MIRRMQQEDENVVYIFEDTTVEEEVVQDCAPPEGEVYYVDGEEYLVISNEIVEEDEYIVEDPEPIRDQGSHQPIKTEHQTVKRKRGVVLSNQEDKNQLQVVRKREVQLFSRDEIVDPQFCPEFHSEEVVLSDSQVIPVRRPRAPLKRKRFEGKPSILANIKPKLEEPFITINNTLSLDDESYPSRILVAFPPPTSTSQQSKAPTNPLLDYSSPKLSVSMSTSRPYNSSYNLVQPSRAAVSQTGKLPINRQKYPISQSKPLGQNELANSSSQSSLKQNEEGGVKDEQFSDDLRENIKERLSAMLPIKASPYFKPSVKIDWDLNRKPSKCHYPRIKQYAVDKHRWLWQFMKELFVRKDACLIWGNQPKGQFYLQDIRRLGLLWGNYKKTKNMSAQSWRQMRYYFSFYEENNIIKLVQTDASDRLYAFEPLFYKDRFVPYKFKPIQDFSALETVSSEDSLDMSCMRPVTQSAKLFCDKGCGSQFRKQDALDRHQTVCTFTADIPPENPNESPSRDL